MLRQVIFRNVDTDEELTMPVTPADFDIEEGRRVETLDMAGAGEVNLPGLETLFERPVEFLLPAAPAPYVTGGWREPYSIVETLRRWSLAGNVVRYIVYGTAVNHACLIESVRYAERDGTNDVYLTVTLKAYRFLAAETLEAPPKATDLAARPDEGQAAEGVAYTVQAGDSLWSICLQYYGDGSLCYRLATYNGIGNSYLIHPGDVLTLPPRETLDATAPTWPPTAPEAASEIAETQERAYKIALADSIIEGAGNLFDVLTDGLLDGSGGFFGLATQWRQEMSARQMDTIVNTFGDVLVDIWGWFSNG